jgi:hypothetical protein
MSKASSNRSPRYRRILQENEEEPLSGLANLFDLGIVFALGLLMATLSFLNLPELLDRDANITLVKNPGQDDMEIITRQGIKLDKYRMTEHSAAGDGERLGVCYRLKSGEVIYVPEKKRRPEYQVEKGPTTIRNR